MSQDDSSNSESSIDAAIETIKQTVTQDENIAAGDIDWEDVRSDLEGMTEFGMDGESMAQTWLNKNFSADNRPTAPSGSSRSGENDPLVDIASQHALEAAVAEQSDTDGGFIAAVFQVVDHLEPRADAMRERLLAGTPTGQVDIAVWEGCNTSFEAGETYHVTGVKVQFHEEMGEYLLGLNEVASVTADPDAHALAEQYEQDIQVDFEPPEHDMEVTGTITGLIDRKDVLITRCTEDVEREDGETVQCNRILDEGTCPDHGEVEGEKDLRAVFRLENNEGESHTIYANAEQVEAITGGGMSMEQALEMFENTMDESVVKSKIESLLLGLRSTIRGRRFGQYGIGVEEHEHHIGGDSERAEALGDRVEALGAALAERARPDNPAEVSEPTSGETAAGG